MKRFIAIVALLLLFANAATAQIGPPPTFKTVASVNKEKGQLTFLESVHRMVPVQKVVVKEVIERVDGMEVKKLVREVVTVYETIIEQRFVLHDLAKSRVITPDGKQLPINEVWDRLKKDTVVVVSADGNTPAKGYLRVLNAETLVLILPQQFNPPIPPPPEKIPPPKKMVD